MPTDANGTYTLPPSYFVQNGDPIQPVQHNPPLEDIAQGLTSRVMRDGRAAMTGDLNFNGHKAVGLSDGTAPGEAATFEQGVPTGAVISYLGATAPTGYLALSGGTFSRTTYARLYAWALTSGLMAASEGAKTHAQFGPADGTTTFTVPNRNAGYFIRGWNTQTVGFDQGRDRTVVQGSTNLAHSHGGSVASAGSHTHTGSAQSAGNHAHTASSDVQGSHAHTGSTDIQGSHTHQIATDNNDDQGTSGVDGSIHADGFANTQAAGAHSHNISTNAAGAHSHNITVNAAGVHTHSLSVDAAGAHAHTIASDGGGEARPNNIALLYCIKT